MFAYNWEEECATLKQEDLKYYFQDVVSEVTGVEDEWMVPDG